jgi:hypothetical protein
MQPTKIEEIVFRLEGVVSSIEDISFSSVQQEMLWRHIHAELKDIQEVLEGDETYHKKVLIN